MTNSPAALLKSIKAEFNLTKQQLEQYQSAFDMFDVDRSGNIKAEELVSVMASLGIEITLEGANDLIAVNDLNGDGIIDLREFIFMTRDVDTNTEPDIEELRLAFNIVDTDKNGYIDIDELKNVIAQLSGSEPSEDEVQHIMKVFDLNQDGRISFEEFQAHMREN